jgi:glycogen debranching enzyme
VRSIQLRDGAAWSNPDFEVCSAGFSALVAFNARELGECTGSQDLLSKAGALADAIDAQWVHARSTWRDVSLAGPDTTAAVRTLDALFAVLVSETPGYVERAFGEIFDPRCFWRPFGPSGTAADEPSFDPRRYWRGDAWPQEIYLLMLAAQRQGRPLQARELAKRLVLGCVGSSYAERWNPDTGAALGAVPQGWAALAGEGIAVLEGASTPPA